MRKIGGSGDTPSYRWSRGGGAGKDEMAVGKELGGCWERGELMDSERFGGNGAEMGGKDLVAGGGAERNWTSVF